MKTFFFQADSFSEELDFVQFKSSQVEKDHTFDPYFSEDTYPIGVVHATHWSRYRTKRQSRKSQK